jgi:hypothetical protein
MISNQDSPETKHKDVIEGKVKKSFTQKRFNTMSPTKQSNGSPKKFNSFRQVGNTIANFRSGKSDKMNSTMFSSFGITNNPKKDKRNGKF